MKLIITKSGAYYRQYVSVGDVVIAEGFTVHGHPFITSKSKNNYGHKVVLQVGYNCEVVQ